MPVLRSHRYIADPTVIAKLDWYLQQYSTECSAFQNFHSLFKWTHQTSCAQMKRRWSSCTPSSIDFLADKVANRQGQLNDLRGGIPSRCRGINRVQHAMSGLMTTLSKTVSSTMKTLFYILRKCQMSVAEMPVIPLNSCLMATNGYATSLLVPILVARKTCTGVDCRSASLWLVSPWCQKIRSNMLAKRTSRQPY